MQQHNNTNSNLSLWLMFVLPILLNCTLLTSETWLKKGIDVRDGIFERSTYPRLKIDTSCANISLNIAGSKYDYNGTVMTGYLKVGKGGSALSFIFYGKENVSQSELGNIPIVLWLNGGPGSSSQLGNFLELGPFWLQQSYTAPYEIIRNKYAWTTNYNILFVDQPVGTGLSYADTSYPNVYCQTMEDVARDFYSALKELYTNPNGCFNRLKFAPDQPLVIFGESYAGKYAPAIAEKIMKEKNDNKGFLTGLKGVAIGDGFTHPYDTFSQMGEFAYNLGLLDYQERSKFEQILLNATYQNMGREYHNLHLSFETGLGLIVTGTGGVNVYDITKYTNYPTELLDEYFKSPEIIKLYQLNSEIKFNNQSSDVYEGLFDDFMKEYTGLVESLLGYDLEVLIYSGQNDLIVETAGTFKWVERLHYEKGDEFRDMLLQTWKVGEVVAGYWKRAGKLELRTVNNAGHLVPMDQGEAALTMLKTFVTRAVGENPSKTEDKKELHTNYK